MEHAKPIRSPAHSRYHPMRAGTARSRISTRMCWPCRSSQGAESSVSKYRMLSETSLLHAPPPKPGLGVKTSAPINSVMASSKKQARTMRRSSRTSKALDSRSMISSTLAWCDCSFGLGEELPELDTVLRALFQNTSPARFIGLCPEGCCVGALEIDHLDARRLLPRDVDFVRLGDLRGLRLDPGRRIGDDFLLRGVEPVPGILVDQDAYLGAVEAGVDAKLRLFVPAEIEDPGDRPAVAVD